MQLSRGADSWTGQDFVTWRMALYLRRTSIGEGINGNTVSKYGIGADVTLSGLNPASVATGTESVFLAFDPTAETDSAIRPACARLQWLR
jgi:hypothetical protein